MNGSIGPHTFLLTLTAVVGVLVAFLSLDFVLARIERTETSAHAESLFEEGTRLLAGNHTEDAIDRFGSAHAMARDSVRYTVALASALLADRRAAAAEEALTPLLLSHGSAAPVNLAMARVMIAERRPQDAISYYHRAIYGEWAGDAAKRRDSVRFELIELLARRADSSALLSELLSVDATAASRETRLRLGKLFLRAGSPQRSIDVYRAILHTRPHDMEALVGLQESEIALSKARLRPSAP
ncbi:MAG: hypothetical protein ABJE47_21425 [bacterium]